MLNGKIDIINSSIFNIALFNARYKRSRPVGFIALNRSR